MNKPETFPFIEWKIENFSCWKEALHGKCVKIHKYDRYEVYPKGFSGLEERMAVCFFSKYWALSSPSELYFKAPNGSLIYKLQLDPIEAQKQIEIPNGPTFEEVAARIRNRETEYGDVLILQLRTYEEHFEHRLCSVIEVMSTTFNIDASELRTGSKKNISYISYSDSDTVYLNTVSSDEDAFQFALDPEEKGMFSVETQMSLISREGSLVMYEENDHLFEKGQEWMFSDSLTKRELTEKGIASILLRIKIITGDTRNNHQHIVYMCSDGVQIVSKDFVCSAEKTSRSLDTVPFNPSNTPLDALLKDLMHLFQDQDFSDVTLKCDNVTFPVHRNILSGRSPVFKTMLSIDMLEAASGQVDIGDLDPSTLARFLTFLYTGSVEDLQCDKAINLYYAADKYQVPSLKKECVDFLNANVSVLNVCDILSLSDRHHDEQLLSVARDCILENYNEVLSSEEWVSLVKSNSLLAAETLTYFAQKNYVGKLETEWILPSVYNQDSSP